MEQTSVRTWGVVLLIAGVLALISGVIAGTSAVVAAGEECGSVFSPGGGFSGGLGAELVNIWCEDDRASRAILTWVLLISGAAAGVTGGVLIARAAGGHPAVTGGTAAELASLAQLHSDGALDDEEYAAAKQQVLAGNSPVVVQSPSEAGPRRSEEAEDPVA